MMDPGRSACSPSAARARLRAMVAERRAVPVPGVANALGARIVEDLGFEAVYLTGAGLTNSELGVPDLGLITMSEVAEAAWRITDVCGLPLIVDIDAGFGGAVNVHRTVRTLERAGAAALQIEDQVQPKRCGHFSGKAVVPLEEMLERLHAALDARLDADTLIIARTDARAVEGLDRALERAQAMHEAGADVLFVEAPLGVEELRRIGALAAPQLVNLVVGGRTQALCQAELRALGFSIVLYANAALQATILATHSVLGRLLATGSLEGLEDAMASFAERQRIVGMDAFDALEARLLRRRRE